MHPGSLSVFFLRPRAEGKRKIMAQNKVRFQSAHASVLLKLSLFREFTGSATWAETCNTHLEGYLNSVLYKIYWRGM